MFRSFGSHQRSVTGVVHGPLPGRWTSYASVSLLAPCMSYWSLKAGAGTRSPMLVNVRVLMQSYWYL